MSDENTIEDAAKKEVSKWIHSKFALIALFIGSSVVGNIGSVHNTLNENGNSVDNSALIEQVEDMEDRLEDMQKRIDKTGDHVDRLLLITEIKEAKK